MPGQAGAEKALAPCLLPCAYRHDADLQAKARPSHQTLYPSTPRRPRAVSATISPRAVLPRASHASRSARASFLLANPRKQPPADPDPPPRHKLLMTPPVEARKKRVLTRVGKDGGTQRRRRGNLSRVTGARARSIYGSSAAAATAKCRRRPARSPGAESAQRGSLVREERISATRGCLRPQTRPARRGRRGPPRPSPPRTTAACGS